MTAHLHKEHKINSRRRVRQGDTISPKLFTATPETIFRQLTWEIRGLKIDSEYLSHLRFADDICVNTQHKLQQLLHELADESENQGLKMTHQYKSTTPRSRTLKATSTYDRDTPPETKTRRRDSEKNHSRMYSIDQAPRHLQG